MTASTIDSDNEQVQRRLELKSSRLSRLERMMEIRLVEDRIQDLFARGLISGTTHTSQGQEAVSVGLGVATRPTDVVCCTYRGHGVALALGIKPEAVLGEVLGRQIGCMGGLGGSMHLSDPDVGLLPTFAIVGAGTPIAVGAALTFATTQSDGVAVSVFGDGATNIGGFHEGLNLAAVWNLPAIFICENNLYGEYSPIASTTAVTDITTRALSYGMNAEAVDGQDLDAVEATSGPSPVPETVTGPPSLKQRRIATWATLGPTKLRIVQKASSKLGSPAIRLPSSARNWPRVANSRDKRSTRFLSVNVASLTELKKWC